MYTPGKGRREGVGIRQINFGRREGVGIRHVNIGRREGVGIRQVNIVRREGCRYTFVAETALGQLHTVILCTHKPGCTGRHHCTGSDNANFIIV